jgi:transcriptional regulator with XRE-family HTH domain
MVVFIGTFFHFEGREGELQASLGDRIRIIRKTNQLNQNEFSNLIGISRATLSELEQGKDKLETILSIHKVFKTNLSWLQVGDSLEENESRRNYTIPESEI